METFFFYLSKIAWLFISPDSLLLILLIFNLFLLYINKIKLAKNLLSYICGFLIFIAFFPVGEWLLYPLESRFPTNPILPEKIDGIIILSGSEKALLSAVWEQIEIGESVERNLAFLTLARKYPTAKLIFSGGTGSLIHQEYKAADVAKNLFAQQNFDTRRIKFERESRNTYENAIYSKKIANLKKDEAWILITTSWHMPRSVGIFCKTKWPVIPYPVDHYTNKDNLLRIDFNLWGNLKALKIAIKEWLGLFVYYISGKTTAILPSKC